jgi:hypothetical protein
MVLFLLFLDYLDTPSILLFSSPSLRNRLTVILCYVAMHFLKVKTNLCLNYETKTQPFYNHCFRHFVQDLCS